MEKLEGENQISSMPLEYQPLEAFDLMEERLRATEDKTTLTHWNGSEIIGWLWLRNASLKCKLKKFEDSKKYNFMCDLIKSFF